MISKDIRLSLSLLLILIGVQANSQVKDRHPETRPAQGTQGVFSNSHLSLNMGSVVFTDFSGNTGFGTFVNSTISTPVTKKFSLQFGTSFYQGFGQPVYTLHQETGGIGMTRQNISMTTITVSGVYTVNPKLTVQAAAYKQFSTRPLLQEANPRAIDFSAEGVAIGFNYKVSDKFEINGMIDYSNGNRGGYGFGNSFYRDPFQPYRSW
ncbi:MAG: hypothetical protein KKD74_12570 [Bacteroidetes bacterium]|nr:hypothetical protein [Bacteroidota bacterium]